MKTKVFSVFPACGKTYLFENQKKYGIKVLDSDSSKFSWKIEKQCLPDMGNGAEYEDVKVRDPEFPNNYITHIKEMIETGEYDAIFVSSHDTVRKALTEAGIEYTIIYPDRSCLNEYIGRCYRRELIGNNGFPIKVLIDNWYNWIDGIQEDIAKNKHDSIVLRYDEYLGSVLEYMGIWRPNK